jgi:hypothetical protein
VVVMARITPKTTEIVTGITLNLSNDDATHLSFALHNAQKYCFAKGYKNDFGCVNWPWLNKFIEELDNNRGTGCTMGPRATK